MLQGHSSFEWSEAVVFLLSTVPSKVEKLKFAYGTHIDLRPHAS